MSPNDRIVIAIAIATFASPTLAQSRWIEKPALPPLSSTAIAFDSSRDRAVLFGGNTGSGVVDATWEWDVDHWVRRDPANSPPARQAHALAYDAARGRVVLFGGVAPSASGTWISLGDTWEWDGAEWQLRATIGPSPRFAHRMANDPSTGQVILFGGIDSSSALFNDTWRWDGAQWTRVAVTSSPPERSNCALATDTVRQRVVLTGGIGVDALGGRIDFDDTWEFDGVRWSQRNPATLPPSVSQSDLVFDPTRARSVMHSSGPLDTWEWDGNDWSGSRPAPSPPYSSNVATFDSVRNRVVLVAAQTSFEPEVWSYSAGAWSPFAWNQPGPIDQPVTAYDLARNRTVVFQSSAGVFGVIDTAWEWDGRSWMQRTLSSTASATGGFAVAADLVGGGILAFGGSSVTSPLPIDETARYDGNGWTVVAAPVRPAARQGHAMVTDFARGRIVMFGGSDASQQDLDDTWEWDGLQWLRRTPMTVPPARASAGIAYDLVRNRTVMYGGFANGVPLDDTWEWDGADWIDRTTAVGPGPRGFVGMTFSPAHASVLLHGGFEDFTSHTGDEVWQWDGTSWNPMQLGSPSPSRYSHAMVADLMTSDVTMFGGRFDASIGAVRGSGTWILTVAPRGSSTSFGSGCSGSASTLPELSALGQPSTGNTQFAIDLTGARPNAVAATVVSFASLQLALGPCTLLVDPAVGANLAHTTNGLGFASIRLAVPDDIGLFGLTAFAQSLVVDPAGPVLPLSFSQGLRLDLGR